MKVLFDSSVLIASMVESHPKFKLAWEWMRRAQSAEISLWIAAHSLAETYSILTTLPLSPRITPQTASTLIAKNILPIAKISSLSAKEYAVLPAKLAEHHFSGGIVYDALIFESAVKARVDKLVTLNQDDFERLSFLGKIVIVGL